MEDLKYPIGKYSATESHTPADLKSFIQRIQSLPTRLDDAIKDLSDTKLNTPYRDGGWTVRQVVHHMADSHMNAYIRMKWILTEETPLIKVYDEKAWAETGETKTAPEISLSLLKALHSKWVALIETFTTDQLKRQLIHPVTQKHMALHNLIGMYAWHGDHHLAHVMELKKRMNW